MAVDAGGTHTCALTAAGGVKCWGWNFFGQLGDGTLTARLTPVSTCVAGSAPDCQGGSAFGGVAMISAGGEHTCALTTTGGVRCWGRNESGQLGDGTLDDRLHPVEVCAAVPAAGACSALQDSVAISAGSSHTCAITTLHGVKCWGGNAQGQLGVGSTAPSVHPRDVCAPAAPPAGLCTPLTGAIAVSTGSSHTCALSSSSGVVCWGSNEFGQLGDDGACGTICTAPVAVCESDAGAAAARHRAAGSVLPSCPPLTGVALVSAGGAHNCALTLAGRPLCWGDNTSGQLGDGTLVSRSRPVELPLADVATIAAGIGFTCALHTGGSVSCWGYNAVSQLGNGGTTDSLTPVDVFGLDDMASIVAGASHTCGVTREGNLACWGFNGDGRLGGGDFGLHSTPVDVVGLGPKTPTTPTPPLTPTPTPITLAGDANCDQETNAVDAALILQLGAGLIDTLPCPASADVNHNGVVDAIDAALVLQLSAGLIFSLPG